MQEDAEGWHLPFLFPRGVVFGIVVIFVINIAF